jgi:hypothetical protein
MKRTDHSEDGRIILKWILRKEYGSVDGINVAPDTDRWRAYVNTVMNIVGSMKAGGFLEQQIHY